MEKKKNKKNNIQKFFTAKSANKRRDMIALICSLYCIIVFILFIFSHIAIKYTNISFMKILADFTEREEILYLTPLALLLIFLYRKDFKKK